MAEPIHPARKIIDAWNGGDRTPVTLHALADTLEEHDQTGLPHVRKLAGRLRRAARRIESGQDTNTDANSQAHGQVWRANNIIRGYRPIYEDEDRGITVHHQPGQERYNIPPRWIVSTRVPEGWRVREQERGRRRRGGLNTRKSGLQQREFSSEEEAMAHVREVTSPGLEEQGGNPNPSMRSRAAKPTGKLGKPKKVQGFRKKKPSSRGKEGHLPASEPEGREMSSEKPIRRAKKTLPPSTLWTGRKRLEAPQLSRKSFFKGLPGVEEHPKVPGTVVHHQHDFQVVYDPTWIHSSLEEHQTPPGQEPDRYEHGHYHVHEGGYDSKQPNSTWQGSHPGLEGALQEISLRRETREQFQPGQQGMHGLKSLSPKQTAANMIHQYLHEGDEESFGPMLDSLSDAGVEQHHIDYLRGNYPRREGVRRIVLSEIHNELEGRHSDASYVVHHGQHYRVLYDPNSEGGTQRTPYYITRGTIGHIRSQHQTLQEAREHVQRMEGTQSEGEKSLQSYPRKAHDPEVSMRHVAEAYLHHGDEVAPHVLADLLEEHDSGDGNRNLVARVLRDHIESGNHDWLRGAINGIHAGLTGRQIHEPYEVHRGRNHYILYHPGGSAGLYSVRSPSESRELHYGTYGDFNSAKKRGEHLEREYGGDQKSLPRKAKALDDPKQTAAHMIHAYLHEGDHDSFPMLLDSLRDAGVPDEDVDYLQSTTHPINESETLNLIHAGLTEREPDEPYEVHRGEHHHVLHYPLASRHGLPPYVVYRSQHQGDQGEAFNDLRSARSFGRGIDRISKPLESTEQEGKSLPVPPRIRSKGSSIAQDERSGGNPTRRMVSGDRPACAILDDSRGVRESPMLSEGKALSYLDNSTGGALVGAKLPRKREEESSLLSGSKALSPKQTAVGMIHSVVHEGDQDAWGPMLDAIEEEGSTPARELSYLREMHNSGLHVIHPILHRIHARLNGRRADEPYEVHRGKYHHVLYDPRPREYEHPIYTTRTNSSGHAFGIWTNFQSARDHANQEDERMKRRENKGVKSLSPRQTAAHMLHATIHEDPEALGPTLDVLEEHGLAEPGEISQLRSESSLPLLHRIHARLAGRRSEHEPYEVHRSEHHHVMYHPYSHLYDVVQGFDPGFGTWYGAHRNLTEARQRVHEIEHPNEEVKSLRAFYKAKEGPYRHGRINNIRCRLPVSDRRRGGRSLESLGFTKSLLFVYGTLKQGGQYHNLLQDARLLGSTNTSPGYKEGLEGSYPVLEEGEPDSTVRGEVYKVSPKTLHSLLSEEDHYELRPVQLQGVNQPVQAFFFKRNGSNDFLGKSLDNPKKTAEHLALAVLHGEPYDLDESAAHALSDSLEEQGENEQANHLRGILAIRDPASRHVHLRDSVNGIHARLTGRELHEPYVIHQGEHHHVVHDPVAATRGFGVSYFVHHSDDDSPLSLTQGQFGTLQNAKEAVSRLDRRHVSQKAFTGTKQDARGRQECYQDGVHVPCQDDQGQGAQEGGSSLPEQDPEGELAPEREEELEQRAFQRMRDVLNAARELPSKLVPERLRVIAGKIKNKAVQLLKDRYGDRAAGLILKAAALSAPLPIIGSQPATIVASLVIAEAVRAYQKLTGGQGEKALNWLPSFRGETTYIPLNHSYHGLYEIRQGEQGAPHELWYYPRSENRDLVFDPERLHTSADTDDLKLRAIRHDNEARIPPKGSEADRVRVHSKRLIPPRVKVRRPLLRTKWMSSVRVKAMDPKQNIIHLAHAVLHEGDTDAAPMLADAIEEHTGNSHVAEMMRLAHARGDHNEVRRIANVHHAIQTERRTDEPYEVYHSRNYHVLHHPGLLSAREGFPTYDIRPNQDVPYHHGGWWSSLSEARNYINHYMESPEEGEKALPTPGEEVPKPKPPTTHPEPLTESQPQPPKLPVQKRPEQPTPKQSTVPAKSPSLSLEAKQELHHAAEQVSKGTHTPEHVQKIREALPHLSHDELQEVKQKLGLSHQVPEPEAPTLQKPESRKVQAPANFHNVEQADQWGDKHFKEWASNLSQEERWAIAAQAGGGYENLNAHLRSGHSLDQAPGRTREVVKGLDSALSKGKAPEDMVVYRGIRGDEDDPNNTVRQLIAAAKNDSTHTDPSYQTASLVGKVAEAQFARRRNGVESAILQIHVPKGSPGAYTGVLGNTGEADWLMPRNSTLRVRTATKGQDGVWRIHAEFVNSEKSEETAQTEDTQHLPSVEELEQGENVPLPPRSEIYPRDVSRVRVKGKDFFVKGYGQVEYRRKYSPHIEQATSEVANLFGVPTPRTKAIEIGGHPKVVTEWVEGSDVIGNPHAARLLGAEPVIANAHVLLDYLLGNTDTNPGNYMLTNDNRIVGIDKEYSFTYGPSSVDNLIDRPHAIARLWSIGTGGQGRNSLQLPIVKRAAENLLSRGREAVEHLLRAGKRGEARGVNHRLGILKDFLARGSGNYGQLLQYTKQGGEPEWGPTQDQPAD